MGRARTAMGLVVAVVTGALLVSGSHEADPQTPTGLPGMPPPFLGVAVLGDGGLTAAVDAYGNVVDLRVPGPAGRALIENPAARQEARTVLSSTGIQVWTRVHGAATPMWQADSIRQRHLPGTNVLRTVARFREERVAIEQAARGEMLAMVVTGNPPVQLRASAGIDCEEERRAQTVALSCVRRGQMRLSPVCGDNCVRVARGLLGEAAASDRRWLGSNRPLGSHAPQWAERMYERSLLVLRALTDRRTGAVAAGARDGWAYVWPRDAGAVAIAFAAAGYRPEAERVTRFLLGLGLEEAARFHGNGSPVPGRAVQGDAIGWVAAAARATGMVDSAKHAARVLAGGGPIPWRDRADYWEGEPGDYLGNAIASAPADVSEFSRHIWGESSDTPSRRGLVREADDADSGLDSAAAWAVRPFRLTHLYPAARATLTRLAGEAGPYGITPGEGWTGGADPWSAPTAWTAWSLAALGERSQALRLMAALRRSATPAGDLPERVDAETGVPRSTTPLAWSHAFTILALQELWPSRLQGG